MSFLPERREAIPPGAVWGGELLGCWRGNAKSQTKSVTVTSLRFVIEFAGASHAQPQVAAGLAGRGLAWLSA